MNLPTLQNQLANASNALNALSGFGNATKDLVNSGADAGAGTVDFGALLANVQPEQEISQIASQNLNVSLGGNTLASLSFGEGEIPSLEKLSAILENLGAVIEGQSTGSETQIDMEALAGLAGGLLSLITSLTSESNGAQTGASQTNTATAAAQAELAQTLAAAKSFVGNLEKLTNSANPQLDGELGAQFKAMIENVSQRLASLDPNLPVKEQLRQTVEELSLIKDALTQAIPKAATSAEAEALMRTQNQAKHAELAHKNGFDTGVVSNQKLASEAAPSQTGSVPFPTQATAQTQAPASTPTPNPTQAGDTNGLQLVQGTSNGQTAEQLAIQQGQQSQTQGQFAATLKSAQDASAGQKVNLPAMAVAIVRQVADGNPRFQIRLDPPELGRIDVRMETDSNGVMNARLSVERPETLDMLARDARALERALQQASGDGQKPNLEFSLKQDEAGEQNGNDDSSDSLSADQKLASDAAQAADSAQNTEITHNYRGFAQPGALNLVV